MILLTLLVCSAVAFVVYIIWDSRPESHIHKWADLTEGWFEKTQAILEEDIENRDRSWHNWRAMRDADRLTLEENKAWQRHVVSILAEDKYSGQTKWIIFNTWRLYIHSQSSLLSSMQVGLSDTYQMDAVHKTREDFIGTMLEYGYDLAEESEKLRAKINKLPKDLI